MITRFFKLSFLLIFIYSTNCFPQDSDSLVNKAKFYYDNQEYVLSIPWFTKKINLNPNDFESLKYRGNCYLESGQNDKAIHDYLHALRIVKKSEVYFNLGNAYERLNYIDSAIYYFNEFNRLEPAHSDGYIKLCIIYMYSHPELGDTAIYFASQAVKKEPESPVNINFLAIAFYSAGHYKSALETAQTGLEIDSSFSSLNQTAGISSFFLKEFPSAISYFDRAYRHNPKDLTLLDYKIQSMLLKNTSQDKIIFHPDQRYGLKEISSENLRKTQEKIKDKNGLYSYRKLFQKFRSAPSNMSIDEYFLMYYGYSFETGYTPYRKSIELKSKDDDPMAKAVAIEDALLKNPTDFPLYLDLADHYQELGNNEKYFENRFKYFGFIESIKASGDGFTPETAFIVNDLSHENSILVSLGYHPKSQKAIKVKKQNFDVINVVNENNQETLIYFNIDRPIDSHSKKQAN
jgi:tetratricopeptide (TPR) repeat protein